MPIENVETDYGAVSINRLDNGRITVRLMANQLSTADDRAILSVSMGGDQPASLRKTLTSPSGNHGEEQSQDFDQTRLQPLLDAIKNPPANPAIVQQLAGELQRESLQEFPKLRALLPMGEQALPEPPPRAAAPDQPSHSASDGQTYAFHANANQGRETDKIQTSLGEIQFLETPNGRVRMQLNVPGALVDSHDTTRITYGVGGTAPSTLNGVQITADGEHYGQKQATSRDAKAEQTLNKDYRAALANDGVIDKAEAEMLARDLGDLAAQTFPKVGSARSASQGR